MAKNKQKSNRGPGAPTKLSKKLTLQIRRLYLLGKSIAEIREKLEIKESTWDVWYWRDTQGFRTNFVTWRRERMLNKSEDNLSWFIDMPTEVQDIEDSDSENGPRAVVVTDPRLVKIKLDATTYITDTLGKDSYSKRVINEDPDAAKKEEVDELRQTLKKIMHGQRMKYSSNFKTKTAQAVK